MGEDATCLEEMESDEIKKIVDLIYTNKPENMSDNTANIDVHEKIVKQVNRLIGQN